jgi:putative hydrolase of the HAD superfamily
MNLTPPRHSIQAVLFDLDNTILDRTKTFGKFTESFLQTYFPSFESLRSLYDRIMDLDQDGYKEKAELFAELLEELPWTHRPSLSELLMFYEEEYVNNAVAMEQAREVLAYVRKKYKTGLITNGKTVIQYGKIDRLGIREKFDCIFVSEEAGVKKPDARIFEMAAKRLGAAPEQCVYVGDHPVNDIEGAAAIGMNTIWIRVNQPWREGLSARPLRTIERLDELLTFF